MRYRVEKDALGEKVIPQESYFGIGTLRAKDAFEITKHGLSRQNIKALAVIKKVAAKTNYEFGFLDKKVCEAISLSADEILNGRLHGQFITDSVQDGFGIGMNMNACEVIANRANEMLGGEKGTYEYVSVSGNTTGTVSGNVIVIYYYQKFFHRYLPSIRNITFLIFPKSALI